VVYANIFATGNFMSACRMLNKKPNIEKTWSQFKAHFAAAHRQHKQMQGESTATSGYHAENASVSSGSFHHWSFGQPRNIHSN
jgi:roadblock/LC7 domain-containing protein